MDMNVEANMQLVDQRQLFAVGSVTINGIFTINDVRVVNVKQPDGDTKPFVFLPRKIENNEWREVLQVTNELKRAINEAVGRDLHQVVFFDVADDDLEISVNLFRKGDLLGYATMTYQGALTIENIKIKKADNEEGIRLVFPHNCDKDQISCLLEVNNPFAQKDITRMVREIYDEKVCRREQERKGETR